MAKTNTTVASSNNASREELINMLLTGTHQNPNGGGRTISEWVQDKVTDAAATAFDGASKIGGAFTAAFSNAKQTYNLERNFRAAELQVKARRTAERYAERLEQLM